MEIFLRFLEHLQNITTLFGQAVRRTFSRPFYLAETVRQMDLIGVGSLPIIILTGFFTGAIMTLQMFPTLQTYGGQSQTGYLVAYTIIRELGPVLTALITTGRVGSAISAEIGSMFVSQQIDAMRALGTDPVRKLVIPRTISLMAMLPLLTVMADLFGIIGGSVVSKYIYGLPTQDYINSVRFGITVTDLVGGAFKPIVFGLLMAVISCYKGLTTEGGTEGVGRATTSAVVTASIVVIIADFFLARLLQLVFNEQIV